MFRLAAWFLQLIYSRTDANTAVIQICWSTKYALAFIRKLLYGNVNGGLCVLSLACDVKRSFEWIHMHTKRRDLYVDCYDLCGLLDEWASERFVHAYTANRYKNEQMELLIWALNTVAVSDLENNDVQRTIHIIIKNKRHTQRLSVLFDTIRFEGNGNNWDFSAIKFSFTSFSTSLRRMSHFWNRISNKQFWASVRSTRIDEYHRQTELILFLFPSKS